MNEITAILKQVATKKEKTYKELLPIIYGKLQELAEMRMSHEDVMHTFSKTDLVHEAYIRLLDIHSVDYNGRSHFYAMASKCMRRILIDHARKKAAQKRGGNKQPVTYVDHLFAAEKQTEWLIDLDDALKELKERNERLVQVIECRYFGEMTLKETANALCISEATVKRDWKKAKGWLYERLTDNPTKS